MIKSFIVNSKDLFDPIKNPKLSLSVKDIKKNKRIPKKQFPLENHDLVDIPQGVLDEIGKLIPQGFVNGRLDNEGINIYWELKVNIWRD